VIFLEKNKIIKYGSLTLVAIFILSTLSLLFLNSNPSVNPNNSVLQGYVIGYAKISSYDKVVKVQNPTKELEKLLEDLSKNGTIVRSFNFENELVIELKDEKDVYRLNKLFNEYNSSIFADAIIDFENLTFFVDSGKQLSIPNQRKKQKITPLFDIAEPFKIKADAIVGEVSSKEPVVYLLSISLLENEKIQIALKPKNITLISYAISLKIPWDSRSYIYDLSSKLNQSNITNKVNLANYLFFNSTPSNTSLSQLASSNIPFISKITKSTISLNNIQTKKDEINNLLSLYNINVIFPDSSIEIENLDTKNINFIEGLVSNYSNLNISIQKENLVEVEFYPESEYGSTKYVLDEDKLKVRFKTTLNPNDIKNISVQAEVVGNKIKDYKIQQEQ